MKIFTVAEMVAAEKAAAAAGVSYDQMMETAGQAVAAAIQARVAVEQRRVLILVGPGNNGGDGLVAGRYLAEAGADVAFYLFKPRNPDTDDNYAQIKERGLLVVEAEFDQRYRVLRTRLTITDVLVDALLGTGVSRPIEGDLARLFKQIQAGLQECQTTPPAGPTLITPHHLPTATTASPPPFTVAVDCPSGLNCDTGTLDPLALPADLTVTFAGPKRGHFIFPGAAACGELVVADIGIEADLAAVQAVTVEMLTAVEARQLLPPRAADGHKGSFGKLLIAAGCDQYRGAPVLSARGAFRTGAGLVALAVPEVVRQTAVVSLPEATFLPILDDKTLSGKSAQMLLSNISRYDALLIGPGLSQQSMDFMQTILAAETLPPLVVDADGLNMLARIENWPLKLPPRTILTPHPAEMARLMDISLSELKTRDRISLAQTQAQSWGHIVLLKGAYTVVAAPEGQVTVLPFANPLLAVGGSGDVLSGVLVALLGQGVAAYEAAVLGGYLHGATSELAPVKAGLLAGEIADLLPEVRQRLQN